METTAISQALEIDVGSLASIATLSNAVGANLEQFTRLHQDGESIHVIWNLSHLTEGRVSLSALTAFLAIACRLRQFTSQVPSLIPPQDQPLIDFLTDISFFEIGRNYNLWTFEEGKKVGVIKPGRTNPNTKIFVFYLDQVPPRENPELFDKWMNWVRLEIKKELTLKCGPLFRWRAAELYRFRPEIADELAIASAEFGLNAVVHGRSPAFIGLQRSSSRISVVASDCGLGFRHTLQSQARAIHEARKMRDSHLAETSSSSATRPEQVSSFGTRELQKKNARHLPREIPFVQSDVQALLLGSLVNQTAYGLRRAINMIIMSGGHVNISSGTAEVQWHAPLWDKVCEILSHTAISSLVATSELALGQPTKDITYSEKQFGYYRELSYGLRGSRIAFELPLDK